MFHIWMSHVPHMNESCPTYIWVISHTWISHVKHIIWHGLSARLQTRAARSSTSTKQSHKWVMSHMLTSNAPHMNQSCPTYIWGVSHVYMSHVPHIIWHGSFVYLHTRAALCQRSNQTNESCPTFEWVMSHILRSDAPYMNQSCPTYIWGVRRIWMNRIPHMIYDMV